MFGILLLAVGAMAQLIPSPTYSPPAATAGTVASSSSPNIQWANVLGNALWFYDAQRSGNLSNSVYGNRVAWRNNSALQDGQDRGIDLTGGWFDAGDYIKCTFPLGFTMFNLAWGALSHGHGFDLASQTAYLDSTLRWGYDWLIKAHPSDDVLYVLVGDPAVDNDYWGGDQNIPDPRPSYPVNSTHPGTDVWASTAAAFAVGSLVYSSSATWSPTSSYVQASSPSLKDQSFASQLLQHAETLYNVANTTTPITLYSDSVPAAASAYTSSGMGDDLCLAALSLAMATNNSQYYSDAYNLYYRGFQLSGSQKAYTWDSKYPALYTLFVEIAMTRPNLATGAGLDANVTGWQGEAERYFDAIVNQSISTGYLTRSGLLYYSDGTSQDDSLQPATAAAFLMFKYAPLASSSDKGNAYVAFAQSQLSYLMGNNPMNVPYIVGMHPNSPKNPHSAAAAGGNNINAIRTQPEQEANVLYGAMVGGPLANDRFWDWRDDWVQTEIALDYNSVLPALAAMQLMNNTADPFYVNLQVGAYSIPSGQPCDDALPCHELSGGQIAGITVGSIVGVLLLVLLGVWIWRRRRRTAYRR